MINRHVIVEDYQCGSSHGQEVYYHVVLLTYCTVCTSDNLQVLGQNKALQGQAHMGPKCLKILHPD